MENGDQMGPLELCICETSQPFEALLYGRRFQEAPDTTARICGDCPVAYQLSAVHALEKLLGVTVPPTIQSLRRLFYCAEWIRHHSVRIYLVQAPALLGYENAVAMSANPDLKPMLDRGLRLKEIGRQLLRLIGSRRNYPTSPCVGGFYYTPRQRDLLQIENELEWGLQAAVDTITWAAGLPLPNTTIEDEFVALSHPTEYPMQNGRVASTKGLDIPSEEFRAYFIQSDSGCPSRLSVRRADGGGYQVGPLARVNLNHNRLSPAARTALQESGLTFPTRNPYMSVVARSLELATALEEALHLIRTYHQPVPSRVPVLPRAGEGCHVTEAPCGMMYHCYRLDRQGLIEEVHVIAPANHT